MKQSFANILDEALVQEFSGRSRDQVRQAFPHHAQRLDPLLKTARNLACVQDVQLPDAEVLRSDRRKFLRAVNQFEDLNVSLGVVDRINKWIGAVIPFTAFKPRSPYQEKRKMNAIFANIALMIVLLLASAGGTLAAAASSLPDSPLYPIKLTVEQIQIDLLADPEKLAAQHLVLAQHRSQEIMRLAQQGTPVQEGTNLRLQKNFIFALQYAAQLENTQMAGLLTRAQHMIQNQLQEMEQVRFQLKVHQQDPLSEPLRILQQIQARVQAGLDDPREFREQARNGFGEAAGNPDCPQGGCLPSGDGNHYRHQRSHPELRFNRYRGENSQSAEYLAPDTENRAGSEECSTDTCSPIGDEHHYGPQPEDPGPGPGQPGGNPDPDCSDCEPSGDEHHYGPQPDQPGSGGSGGNPDCSQMDCEAEGNQHQGGQPPSAGDGGGNGEGGEGSGGGDGSGGQGGKGNP